MRKTQFAPPCGTSRPLTAVASSSKAPLTNPLLPIPTAHASGRGFRIVLFLQLLVAVTVTLAVAGCGSTVAGGMGKSATAGALTLSTSSLSFGTVTVGNSSSESVVLTNSGSASLQVSQIQVKGSAFSVVGAATAPLTLAAGASSTLNVAFTPRGAGNATGSLSVVTDSATDTIALSGNGTITAQPALTLSATSLAFGTVTVNTPVAQSVELTSSGTAPLTISGAMMSGSGFTMSNTAFPLTLNPGDKAMLTLTFDPTNAGQFSGSVTLNTNAASGVATIEMSGSARPIQSLLHDFTCTSDNVVGEGSENCSISLNAPAGPGGLTVGLASSSTAVTVPAAMTVPEGTSSGSFTLSYSAVPTAQTVTLTASSSNSKKQHNLNLGSSTAGLSLSPGALNFGTVTVNSKSTQAITLTSSGTSSLTINAATVSGVGYAVSGVALPLTLKPGQSANLMVSFDPTTNGSYSGNVTLTTNTTTGSAGVTLNGSAQAGALAGVNCASGTMTGTGSDLCTVSLTAAAPSGGLTVALSSSNAAVAVPASVVVPAGATSVGFTAVVSSVTTSQTATLTAQAGGVVATYAITLDPAATAVLSGISCANGSMTGAGSDACTVSLTAAAPSGGLSVGLISSSNAVAVPASVLVPAGATSAGFAATVSSVTTAQTATLTAEAGGVTATYSISLAPAASPVLSAMSCATSSMSGAGTDACTVSLSGAAPTGGTTVALSSNSTAVVVPASVLVPAGGTSAGFVATLSSVTTAQTATLTAQSGGVAKTYAISLSAGTPGLTLSSTTVAFGNVNLNTPTTQTVLLTSSGTAPVTISAASVTGTGFTISGLALPLTLNAGQTATLTIQFDPTTTTSSTGAVNLTTNTSAGGATIALSGTGQTASYTVDLTWSAPSTSSDPVVGYRVYRAANGTSSYQAITSSLESSTSYADSTVVSGTNYTYYVVSVDSAGNQSAPSNTFAVSVP